MNIIDREGTFRGEIINYGLKQQQSGSVAVSLQVRINEQWDDEKWDDWREFGMEAFGDIYVVKRDGKIHEAGVQSLVKNCGWDGTFTSVSDQTWKPKPCQIAVKANEYKGNVTYQIAFVNDYDRPPGALGALDPESAKALQVKYGGELRALSGNLKTNASKPTGKPPMPVNRTNLKKVNEQLQEAGVDPDDIPF